MVQIEGPLVRELREIGEGRRDFPPSKARRHHFVPAFLLARFTAPPRSRKSWMFQLDTKTGKPQKTTPDSACFEKFLYTQEADDGRDNMIEALFSIVEGHAADAIRRLVEDPLNQTPEDRETLSYFLAFQFTRTPVTISQLGGMSETLTEAIFGMQYADPVGFRNLYREAIEEEATGEEIERMRKFMQERLRNGEIRMDNPRLPAFNAMLPTADAVAETIH